MSVICDLLRGTYLHLTYFHSSYIFHAELRTFYMFGSADSLIQTERDSYFQVQLAIQIALEESYNSGKD